MLGELSGTLSVEEVYKDRDQFATLVREVAAPDVGRMGIEILSFTIKDVYDDVQYLASLGKAQTAAVKRDADVGVAEANRDAGIRVRSHWFESVFKARFPDSRENSKFHERMLNFSETSETRNSRGQNLTSCAGNWFTSNSFWQYKIFSKTFLYLPMKENI